MIRFPRQILLASLGLLAMGLAGCGEPTKSVFPVTGKVTFNGETVTTGSIVFVPVGGGPPAEGNINENGEYQMTTFQSGDGAVPGRHQVMVTALKDNGPNAAPSQLIPIKYSSGESDLFVEVTDQDLNKLDLKLEGTPPKKVKPTIMP